MAEGRSRNPMVVGSSRAGGINSIKMLATLDSNFRMEKKKNRARGSRARSRAAQKLTCDGLFAPQVVKGTGEYHQYKVYGSTAVYIGAIHPRVRAPFSSLW